MSVDTRPKTRAKSPSALRVLALRNFFPYFLGNLLSNCGTWFQNIAQALLVYRLTHSTFFVGLVNFAQFAGVLLFASLAGRAADRFDRKKLLIATQLGAIVVTGTLAWLTHANLVTAPIVIAFAFLLSFTIAFAIPALQAVVPSLVARDEVPAAVALNSVTFNLARVIGPLAGAFVVSRYGIAWAFTVNCVSFAALICALLLVTLNTGSYSAERPRLSDSIRAVAKDARLLALFGVIAAVSLSSDPVNTLTPAFATHVLHRPDTFAGYLIGAFGTGAVVAAFVVARRGEMRLRHMTATLVVMSAGMLGFAGARSLPFTVLALAAGGFGYLASQSAATSVVQLTVEENERGRMMALWSVSFLGVRPVGSVVDGVVASVGGLHWAALVMALPVIVATAALALVSRRLERPLRGDR